MVLTSVPTLLVALLAANVVNRCLAVNDEKATRPHALSVAEVTAALQILRIVEQRRPKGFAQSPCVAPTGAGLSDALGRAGIITFGPQGLLDSEWEAGISTVVTHPKTGAATLALEAKENGRWNFQIKPQVVPLPSLPAGMTAASVCSATAALNRRGATEKQLEEEYIRIEKWYRGCFTSKNASLVTCDSELSVLPPSMGNAVHVAWQSSKSKPLQEPPEGCVQKQGVLSAPFAFIDAFPRNLSDTIGDPTESCSAGATTRRLCSWSNLHRHESGGGAACKRSQQLRMHESNVLLDFEAGVEPKQQSIHREAAVGRLHAPIQAVRQQSGMPHWRLWRKNAIVGNPQLRPTAGTGTSTPAGQVVEPWTWRPETVWPARTDRPSWATALRANPDPRRVLQAGISVPCSAVEPLCAGLGALAQRVLQLRLHVARAGTQAQEEIKARNGSVGDDWAQDVWWRAQHRWSPLTVRFWSQSKGSASESSARATGQAGRYVRLGRPLAEEQRLRNVLAASLSANKDILLGHDADALRAGDDWLLYWQQMTDRYSLWFGHRIDLEPSVLFLPQAGTTSRGRAWGSGGQYVPMACGAYSPMQGGRLPVPPPQETALKQHIQMAAKLVNRDGHVGPLVSIGQDGCIGPAHMLLECLPRLLAVRQLTARTPGAAIHTTSSNALSQSVVEAAGIDSTVPMTSQPRLAAPLVVMPDSTHCGHPTVAQLLLLRRFVSVGLGLCPSEAIAAESLLPSRLVVPVREPLDSRGVAGEGTPWVGRPAKQGTKPKARPGTEQATERVSRTGPPASREPPKGAWSLERPCSPASELTQMLVSAIGLEATVRAIGTSTPAGQAMSCAGPGASDPGGILHGVIPPVSVRNEGVRVIVVRRSSTRRLVNHAEIVSAIRALPGVASVTQFAASAGGDPRPWAHWARWKAADVVVAPHGAGLANAIALPPWAHVVEVLAAQLPNFMFAGVAMKQGLRYHALLAHDMHHHSEGTVEVQEVLGAVTAAAREIRSLSAEAESPAVRSLCATQ